MIESKFQHALDARDDKARQEPVVITEYDQDPLIVMSANEWERLRHEDRRVGLTAELDPQ